MIPKSLTENSESAYKAGPAKGRMKSRLEARKGNPRDAPHEDPGTVVTAPGPAVPLLGHAAEYIGKVIAVADGDTLRVLYQGGQLKVRLAEIDTPEKGQPYGSRAREGLTALCFRKEARMVEQARDRYGCIVGRVYCAGVDANAAMIRQGAAWVYRQYATDPTLLRAGAGGPCSEAGLVGLTGDGAHAAPGSGARPGTSPRAGSLRSHPRPYKSDPRPPSLR